MTTKFFKEPRFHAAIFSHSAYEEFNNLTVSSDWEKQSKMESQAINGHEDNKEILEQNGTDVTEKPTTNGDSNDHSHTIDEEPFIRYVFHVLSVI